MFPLMLITISSATSGLREILMSSLPLVPTTFSTPLTNEIDMSRRDSSCSQHALFVFILKPLRIDDAVNEASSINWGALIDLEDRMRAEAAPKAGAEGYEA